MIRTLLAFILPVIGRMSPSEAAGLGRALTDGVGYIGFGPVLVLFDLPAFLRKKDVEPDFRVPTLDEINSALRAQRAEQEEASKNPPSD